MLRIITKSGFRVTLKTAAEIASGLTQAYIAKIAEQISPLNVGETVCLMKIATEYGSRLNKRYGNLRDESSLDTLVSGYSSHSFVIDLEEAEGMFERVLPASAPLERLMDTLGWDHAFPLDAIGQDSIVAYLRGKSENSGDAIEATLGAGDVDAANANGHNKVAKGASGETQSGSSDGGSRSEADNSARASEKPKLVKR